VLFKWEGDPDQHLAAYDREMMHPVPREQPRRISHTCARGNDKRRTGNPNLRSSPYTRYMLLSRAR